MIKLLCYEPAGRTLTLSADDLTRHILGLGATGCGKTSGLINPILQQVISRNANDPTRKAGLLVLDPKNDDTQDKVRAYARNVGRADDVRVLSETGDCFYGYFSDFRRLEQVDEFTRRVLYGSREMGDQNAYWTESRFGLINAALTILLATGQAITFDAVAEFLRAWFFSSHAREVTEALQFVERLLAVGTIGPASRRRLQLALAEAANWRVLDQRTRELHKSTLNNALRSLLSPAARDLFDESKGQRFNPADVLQGKILVASVNSISHPQVTSLLFRALKRDYYEAVLARSVASPETDRLCGLILDELPLSILPDDVSALAVLRSKGGFVVACAQGLNGLDDVIGRRQRVALLANFNSLFYFSAHEEQTDEHAMLTLGTHEAPAEATSPGSFGSTRTEEPPQSGQLRWICPPGSLARLPQHHVYARLANGTVTTKPVWLEAIFHEFRPSPSPACSNDLAEAIASLKAHDDEAAKANPDLALLLLHMHRRGVPLRLTPNLVAGAWQLCRPRVHRNRLLSRLNGRIQGIENLPSCWLLGLSRWLQRNATFAPSIVGASVKSGILWPELDPAWKLWGEGPLTIPEAINRFIYPSLWRPLLARHRAQLMTERPDLRSEIEGLPHEGLGREGV